MVERTPHQRSADGGRSGDSHTRVPSQLPLPSARPWSRGDALVLAGLGALVVGVALWVLDRSRPPAEDAAMLMRYSVNLAAGHGIVWNIGDAPVDGATDLGFMAIVAGAIRAGLSAENAARIVNFAAILGTVGGCYVFARRFHRAGVFASGAIAVFVATSPVVVYAEAGFGTPTFGVFVAFLWMATEVLRRQPESSHAAIALGAAVIVCGLIRPEGFLIGAVAFAALLVNGGRVSVRGVAIAAAIAIGGGLVFLLWRWSYFGYPLPNPYYKKGSGQFHLDSLRPAVKQVAILAWPLLGVAALGLLVSDVRRRSFSLLLAIALYTSLWMLLSDETNYRGRFQYPALVILAFAVPGVVPYLIREGRRGLDRLELRQSRRALARALITGTVLLVLLVGCVVTFHGWSEMTRPHYGVATALAKTPDRGRTVVTTEAGLIPLLSGWRSVDAWGLNDQQIAHHGVITRRRLRQIDPAVIVIHAPTSPRASTIDAGASRFLPGWTAMSDRLIRFAEANDYELAAAFGTVEDTLAVYIRRGMDDTELLAKAIRSVHSDEPNLAELQSSLPTRSG